MRLILIYRPSEGGRLSQPRHCSKWAYRSDLCEKRKLLSAVWFNPGTFCAAGKCAATRSLWPAAVHTSIWCWRVFFSKTRLKSCYC